jgi:hypothetical protein
MLPEYADDNSVLNSELVKDYEDIFINVHEWEIFQESDIDLNNILEASNEIPAPDFVTNFERMLDRRPGLRPEMPCCLDSQSRAAYFELREGLAVEDESHEETQQPLRYVELLEALHIGQLVSYEWQKLWQGQGGIKYTLKGCEANGIFFFHFFVQTHGTTTVNRYVLTCLL